MDATHSYDVIIVGGGPAGLTAAIYAARAALRVVVLESNVAGGLVNGTYMVENFPSWPFIHGMELMEKMRAHAEKFHATIEEVCEVTSLDLSGDIKKVMTDDAVYEAPAVILCTGRTPVPLETPTTAENVHFCAVCDGAAYKDKDVVVVGGGNSAFDESLYMLGLGVRHITLVESMPRYFAAESVRKELFASGKVEGLLSTRVVDLVAEGDSLRGVVLENTETGEQRQVEASGVFVFLGQRPRNELFRELLPLTEQGYIRAGADMSVGIPGVFAAGDIVDKSYRQIITASADGAIAALSAERYLRAQRGETA
ncbi:FAD-dependent oxidoreductase [uncultured Desulfovibrio sp.]|uniref:NAD(P)/FAD-dependent oxidoreductase n=1 Tax=uncultured Desulfovibrio sp. TaxID=167968 RepID=UPI00262638D1|nr:FAD-dependent oxidoreductase [uncultured Desulfovibrio sp.]